MPGTPVTPDGLPDPVPFPEACVFAGIGDRQLRRYIAKGALQVVYRGRPPRVHVKRAGLVRLKRTLGGDK